MAIRPLAETPRAAVAEATPRAGSCGFVKVRYRNPYPPRQLAQGRRQSVPFKLATTTEHGGRGRPPRTEATLGSVRASSLARPTSTAVCLGAGVRAVRLLTEP